MYVYIRMLACMHACMYVLYACVCVYVLVPSEVLQESLKALLGLGRCFPTQRFSVPVRVLPGSGPKGLSSSGFGN